MVPVSRPAGSTMTASPFRAKKFEVRCAGSATARVLHEMDHFADVLLPLPGVPDAGEEDDRQSLRGQIPEMRLPLLGAVHGGTGHPSVSAGLHRLRLLQFSHLQTTA